MMPVRHWPLQRPRWVGLVGLAIGLGGVLSIGYCFSSAYAALAALPVLWHLWQRDRLTPCAADVCLTESGGWLLRQADLQRPLSLDHAWSAFGWVTLRFHDLRANGPKDAMLELTIWKAAVSAQAWRELNVIIGSHSATARPAGAREA